MPMERRDVLVRSKQEDASVQPVVYAPTGSYGFGIVQTIKLLWRACRNAARRLRASKPVQPKPRVPGRVVPYVHGMSPAMQRLIETQMAVSDHLALSEARARKLNLMRWNEWDRPVFTENELRGFAERERARFHGAFSPRALKEVAYFEPKEIINCRCSVPRSEERER